MDDEIALGIDGQLPVGVRQLLAPRERLPLTDRRGIGVRQQQELFPCLSPDLRRVVQSFRYSRSRFVCARLTGISVPFASFIRRM